MRPRNLDNVDENWLELYLYRTRQHPGGDIDIKAVAIELPDDAYETMRAAYRQQRVRDRRKSADWEGSPNGQYMAFLKTMVDDQAEQISDLLRAATKAAEDASRGADAYTEEVYRHLHLQKRVMQLRRALRNRRSRERVKQAAIERAREEAKHYAELRNLAEPPAEYQQWVNCLKYIETYSRDGSEGGVRVMWGAIDKLDMDIVNEHEAMRLRHGCQPVHVPERITVTENDHVND